MPRRNDPPAADPHDDLWDVFELDDEAIEPEPEYGDFWEEVDDALDSGY
jgi:hypothetical protein